MATIEVVGQVYKVQTLVDGGIRLTLDLPESAVAVMGELAKLQINGIVVNVKLVPQKDK